MEEAEVAGDETDSVVRRQLHRHSVVSLASYLTKTSAHSLRRAIDASLRPSSISQLPRPNSEEEAKEEEAWLQAEYNAVTFAVLAALFGITVAVYFVLEPFLHPLLWAVLAGNFLFPFKWSTTSTLRQWLDNLDSSHVPLSVGVLLSPLTSFNYLSWRLDSLIDSYWFHLKFLAVAVISLYLGYQLSVYALLYTALEVLNGVFDSVHSFLSYAPLLQVLCCDSE